MNDLDDARLRAHLERRSGIGEPAHSLAAAVSLRAAATAQTRPSPATRLGVGRGWLALAAALAGVAVVIASAGLKPPVPAPDGGAPALTVLTPGELVELVTQTPAVSWLNRVVIVDADFEPLRGLRSCEGPCPIGYISGTDRRVAVGPDSDPTFSSSGWSITTTSVDGRIRGPLALRLTGQDAVELIGPVHHDSTSDAVWSLETFLTEAATLAARGPTAGSDGVAVGPLFVVDAWLAQSPYAPPCPLPQGLPISVIPYTCGIQAWLSPRYVQPTELDAFGSAPAGGVRVQNSAYDEFASNPARSGSLDTPVPRRALYLVRSILEFPHDRCAGCADRPAYVVARLDPVPRPDTAIPSDPPPHLTPLTADELARLVASIRPRDWGDRVVIVIADIDVATFSCPLFTSPSCPIGSLSGTDPGLLVWTDSDPAYVDDASARTLIIDHKIEGPIALRLATSGRVELVGQIATSGDAMSWSLGAFVNEIERLQSLDARPLPGPDRVAVGPLYVVDAWLVSPMTPQCAAQETDRLAAIAGFECGAPGLLTPRPVQPTRLEGTTIVTDTPPGSVRVQNWAYDSFAFDPNWSTALSLAEPRRALYLVQSILEFPPDSCFMCNLAGQAFLVARLDPIDVPRASVGSPAD